MVDFKFKESVSTMAETYDIGKTYRIDGALAKQWVKSGYGTIVKKPKTGVK